MLSVSLMSLFRAALLAEAMLEHWVRAAPRAPVYLGCTSGHYGFDCSGTCKCDPVIEDCADGPTVRNKERSNQGGAL